MTDATDTPAPTTPDDPMAGFAEAMVGLGNPVADAGHPEKATAVETSATDEAPKAETETPVTEPVKAADTPAPTKTVNFDDFSDSQKTTLQRLLKAGSLTPEEVEDFRKGVLRQNLFSKKTDVLARDREAWEKEVSDWKADKALLEKIRGDDKLHAAWLKMSRGEVPAEDAGADDLVDRRKAEEIAQKAIENREREKADRTAKEQAVYDKKFGALKAASSEMIAALEVTPQVMQAYINAEAAELDPTTDPVLYITPEEFKRRITSRHRIAVAEARAKTLEEQLSQRTNKADRTSKQSSPPVRRVSDNGSTGPLEQTMADLGIAPDWSNVTGLGFRQ